MRFKNVLYVSIPCALGILLLAGCSTTSNVVVNPAESGQMLTSAFLVTHGGNSTDMDNAFKNALIARGLKVTEGESEPQPVNADIVVKYKDSWRWDMAMYLQSVSAQIYDGKNGDLVSESTWRNSLMHSFPDVNKVVAGLLDKTFVKLGAKTPSQ